MVIWQRALNQVPGLGKAGGSQEEKAIRMRVWWLEPHWDRDSRWIPTYCVTLGESLLSGLGFSAEGNLRRLSQINSKVSGSPDAFYEF